MDVEDHESQPNDATALVAVVLQGRPGSYGLELYTGTPLQPSMSAEIGGLRLRTSSMKALYDALGGSPERGERRALCNEVRVDPTKL